MTWDISCSKCYDALMESRLPCDDHYESKDHEVLEKWLESRKTKTQNGSTKR